MSTSCAGTRECSGVKRPLAAAIGFGKGSVDNPQQPRRPLRKLDAQGQPLRRITLLPEAAEVRPFIVDEADAWRRRQLWRDIRRAAC